MEIAVVGATGFVGNHLVHHLHARGHRVTAIARGRRTDAAALPAAAFLAGPWQEALREAQAVIHLVGRSIAGRWSRAAKEEIRSSRIASTCRVVEALRGGRCRLLLHASGVGYYGDGGDALLVEDSPAGTGFLAELARDWEAEARRAEELGVRVVAMRFGVVLGNDGGALPRMVPAFRAFLGGPLGSGSQWFSWIHIADLAAAVSFLLEGVELAGAVNFCAPEPVTQRDFAAALGRVLGRPSFFPAPAFALRLALGEAADLLLAGQRAIPRRLLEAGFRFRYPVLAQALEDLLGRGAA